MADAELIFGPGHKADAFYKKEFATHFGDDDAIVRELVQNALDAARETDEVVAEVTFRLADVPTSDIPGLGRYKEGFARAQELRHELNPDELGGDPDVIQRIESALSNDLMPVLFCRDNGSGLDSDGLFRLLTEGNTKKKTGGGSQGVGHITAFASSDLRYVVYAGRQRAGSKARDVGGGAAVLAAHSIKGEDYGAEGTWMLPGSSLMRKSKAKFPKRVPDLIVGELNEVGASGSVVAILGFDQFRQGSRTAAIERIARSVALNFLGAIENGDMIVRVTEDQDPEATLILDRRTAGETIAQAKGGHRGGRFPPDQAKRTWETMHAGEEVTIDGHPSVHVRMRKLDPKTGGRTRVQVFRGGMWITNRATRLETSEFGEHKPFDAVVTLSEGRTYDLVRKSEGPLHLGIDRERLTADEWKELTGTLSDIAEALKALAGEVDPTEGESPADFAMIHGGTVQQSAPVPPPRPRIVRKPKRRKKGRESGNGSTPRSPGSGPQVQIRSRVLPTDGDDTHVTALHAILSVNGELSPKSQLGLRVYVASGSDASCEQQLTPEWLPIQGIESAGSLYQPRSDNPFEVVLPPPTGTFKVILGESIDTDHLGFVRLDAVRRRVEQKAGG